MRVEGKVVVVTGGGSGIGRALCERFAREKAAAVVVVDRHRESAAEVAAIVGGIAMAADVSVQADVERVVDETEHQVGPIGLFCSNAGVLFMDPDFDDAASDTTESWMRGFGVHVLAHVHAARALIPRYKSRGSGWFLQTASAAGLLSQIGGGVYGATKHAAIAFAEHLAITHREHGIGVSVVCPQAVDTAMMRGASGHAALKDGILPPEKVADAVIAGLQDERFLILPHPEVLGYLQKKTADYDRWIAAMARLRAATRPAK
jgi:NAD(P)-dependent dehydrogenase (short-subunit alcohol dehydrogenase family)